MIILLSPQIRDDNKIWYDIEENKITATIDGMVDTFDFTDVPDGELKIIDDITGESLIETTLPTVPIVSASKYDGELTVKLLFSIGIWEQDDRILYPEPMTVEEFNDLMSERTEVEPDGEDGLEGQ